MTTLAEIESAVESLSADEKYRLYRHLEGQLQGIFVTGRVPRSRSVLEIAPVHLGTVLRPSIGDEDLLSELL